MRETVVGCLMGVENNLAKVRETNLRKRRLFRHGSEDCWLEKEEKKQEDALNL